MKIILFANTDWYLYNFRLSLANELRKAGHDVLLISPSGTYGEKLRAAGFRWQPIPMERRSLNPLRELLLLTHLWRLFRNESPALVHGFTIKSAIYGAFAARLAGVPARVSAIAGMGYVFISNDVKARLLRPFVRTLMRIALGGRNARLVLQNNDDVALFTSAGIVDSGSIRLIRGSGVDCNRFKPPRHNLNKSSPFRVLLIGRLLWDKGIREFVDAARQLKRDGRNIQFILAGAPDAGNPASVPESAVLHWQNEALLTWVGHVEDVPRLLTDVDLMVLPSYREGLPKSLIEGAASALPLIASDVPGCREVITDGIDGLLVPVQDSISLAAAIARLDDDRTLAKRLGIAARKKVLNEFEETIIVRETVKVYEEILHERVARPGAIDQP